MTCQTCAIPLAGCIDMKCAMCVARKIISTRPRKDLQKQFIEVSRRTPDGAGESDILAAIKFIDGGEV